MDDIIFLKDKCPKDDYPIIECVIRSINQSHIISNVHMNELINMLADKKYKGECLQLLSKPIQLDKYNTGTILDTIETNIVHHNRQTCPNCECGRLLCPNAIQNEVISKILSHKQNETYIELPKVSKPCPHCGKINSAPIGTKYIVCGIDTVGIIPFTGFEHHCLKDWCFVCGKKLCKSWFEHQLYDTTKRHHDIECCKKDATQKNVSYKHEYCQCHTSNVDMF